MTNAQFLASASTPEKVGVEGLEDKWSLRWEQDGVYRFRRETPRELVYSIDTPPPTVSGHLHLGHVALHLVALQPQHRLDRASRAARLPRAT